MVDTGETLTCVHQQMSHSPYHCITDTDTDNHTVGQWVFLATEIPWFNLELYYSKWKKRSFIPNMEVQYKYGAFLKWTFIVSK